MAPEQAAPKKMVGLPLLVASPVDLGRLLRELEAIDGALMQSAVRSNGEHPKMPKTTQLMDKTIELNRLDLLQEIDRKLLKQFLSSIQQRAPHVHMSFSADPSPQFVEKLTGWLREHIHPLVLITIGLQPNIGAGCVVRTTNKYFDMSLAKDFHKNRDLLMSKLRAAAPEPASAPVAEVQPA